MQAIDSSQMKSSFSGDCFQIGGILSLMLHGCLFLFGLGMIWVDLIIWLRPVWPFRKLDDEL